MCEHMWLELFDRCPEIVWFLTADAENLQKAY